MELTSLQATAQRLLKANGATMVLKTTTRSTFDPTAGTYSTESTATDTCYGAILNFSKQLVNGVTILFSDRRVFLDAKSLSTAPVVGDRVSIGGVDWDIVTVNTVSPDGLTVVYYDLQVRK